VCHGVLQDPAFFHFLTRVDEEFASGALPWMCRAAARGFPRKPRGCPAAVRE
jgi:hypothetical protein